MAFKRTIAVDIDGTILKNLKIWKGIHHFGKPERKVKECLKFLRNHGFNILIHSTRLNPTCCENPLPWIRMNVEEILNEHGIPYDQLFTGIGKPLAEFYVDDRAVLYAGNWEETMKEILARAERSFKNVY